MDDNDFFVPKLLAPATVKHIHKGFFIKQAFLPQQMNQHLIWRMQKKPPAVLMECRRALAFSDRYLPKIL
ncbi:hypothetical protein HMPREF9441_02159 [Paraprevotella clara YIT 11840]|uniref:Uncharacterized protein n=1 Tax=Paraprevotella clara YIT 11840 TaxID=762968 RepID=G5SS10_9BACT|nr:hypothetical protein HMPREF9441_02159 [Paraprevotella clara YIT 11840]